MPFGEIGPTVGRSAAARGGDFDALADPERIDSLDLGFLDDRSG